MFHSYVYPEPVSPVPTESGYNGQSLERASSIGEIPCVTPDTNGYIANGYTTADMNGGSVATSPTPYDANGYNGNDYAGYNENGSIISTNGNESAVNGFNGNGSSIGGYNGYNGSENNGSQFVRRRLLPAIPRGESLLLLLWYIGSCFMN